MTGEKIKSCQERLIELFDSLPYSDVSIADQLSVSKQAISAWRSGTRSPKKPTLEAICNHFGVDIAWLMGYDVPRQAAAPLPAGMEVLPPHHTIPVLGSIACGTPITAEENVEDYVSAPADLACHFALRCKGDSMAPRILDGDLVYIRKQEDVTDGQIAAVVIDDEATLKHVYHIPGGVQLISDNPNFRPLTYVGETCEGLRIVGLAVAYQRMLV